MAFWDPVEKGSDPLQGWGLKSRQAYLGTALSRKDAGTWPRLVDVWPSGAYSGLGSVGTAGEGLGLGQPAGLFHAWAALWPILTFVNTILH